MGKLVFAEFCLFCIMIVLFFFPIDAMAVKDIIMYMAFLISIIMFISYIYGLTRKKLSSQSQ